MVFCFYLLDSTFLCENLIFFVSWWRKDVAIYIFFIFKKDVILNLYIFYINSCLFLFG